MRIAPIIAPAITLACAPLAAPADPVLVELFTSQGCSSCPPADAMLGELAARDDVLALSFHVDYWDWIGWADTFGDPAHSDRQRRYAAAAASSMVYTPQFVIGGSDRVAGARAMDVLDAVGRHAEPGSDVLSVGPEGTLVLARADGSATLSMALVEPEATVSILRGENAGRSVTYHNVVRGWRDLGAWDGRPDARSLPPAPDGLRRVVVAQAVGPEGHPGAVLGAVAVD